MKRSRLKYYFDEYARYHTKTGNKLCHYFGIPMIVLTLLGLLSRLTVWEHGVTIDGGMILILVATAFFMSLDWKLALPILVPVLGMYYFAREMPLGLTWAIFIGGWIMQGIGHSVYEKKSPAFFKNFEHVLVGPLWVFARLIGYRAR